MHPILPFLTSAVLVSPYVLPLPHLNVHQLALILRRIYLERLGRRSRHVPTRSIVQTWLPSLLGLNLSPGSIDLRSRARSLCPWTEHCLLTIRLLLAPDLCWSRRPNPLCDVRVRCPSGSVREYELPELTSSREIRMCAVRTILPRMSRILRRQDSCLKLWPRFPATRSKSTTLLNRTAVI
ncbi:hypothetical protein C8Q76DRAFT_178491 [Earliella scabrosa]|nr:hypothetical protein C8Q76DRAFT_178491 [Earliella scabrosa]